MSIVETPEKENFMFSNSKKEFQSPDDDPLKSPNNENKVKKSDIELAILQNSQIKPRKVISILINIFEA